MMLAESQHARPLCTLSSRLSYFKLRAPPSRKPMNTGLKLPSGDVIHKLSGCVIQYSYAPLAHSSMSTMSASPPEVFMIWESAPNPLIIEEFTLEHIIPLLLPREIVKGHHPYRNVAPDGSSMK